MTDLLDLIDQPDPTALPGWADDTIGRAFWQFHLQHPAVYEAFVRLARDWRRARPDQPCGAKAIWEVLRWQHAVGDLSPDRKFKLNNNYPALYSRLVLERESDLSDPPIFLTRERLTDDHRHLGPVRPPERRTGRHRGRI